MRGNATTGIHEAILPGQSLPEAIVNYLPANFNFKAAVLGESTTNEENQAATCNCDKCVATPRNEATEVSAQKCTPTTSVVAESQCLSSISQKLIPYGAHCVCYCKPLTEAPQGALALAQPDACGPLTPAEEQAAVAVTTATGSCTDLKFPSQAHQTAVATALGSQQAGETATIAAASRAVQARTRTISAKELEKMVYSVRSYLPEALKQQQEAQIAADNARLLRANAPR